METKVYIIDENTGKEKAFIMKVVNVLEEAKYE